MLEHDPTDSSERLWGEGALFDQISDLVKEVEADQKVWLERAEMLWRQRDDADRRAARAEAALNDYRILADEQIARLRAELDAEIDITISLAIDYAREWQRAERAESGRGDAWAEGYRAAIEDYGCDIPWGSSDRWDDENPYRIAEEGHCD